MYTFWLGAQRDSHAVLVAACCSVALGIAGVSALGLAGARRAATGDLEMRGAGFSHHYTHPG